MKITLFTLDMRFPEDTPDKTLDSPLHQFCMSTWDIVLNYIRNQGYEAELVIYNNESEEFKYVFNDIICDLRTQNQDRKAHYTDIFRMYILSKYPYHIWLDWDVYILKTFELDLTKPYRLFNWFIMYNANDLETYAKIYECFKTIPRFRHLGDRNASEYLIENNIIENDFTKLGHTQLIHCSFLENDPDALYIIREEDENTDLVQNNILDKHNYRFINPLTKHHRGIKGLYNEKPLIKFVLEHCKLSEKSKEILQEALNDN